jgi:hypothetical protein
MEFPHLLSTSLPQKWEAGMVTQFCGRQQSDSLLEGRLESDHFFTVPLSATSTLIVTLLQAH